MGITTQPVTVEYYLPWLTRSFVDDAAAVLLGSDTMIF